MHNTTVAVYMGAIGVAWTFNFELVAHFTMQRMWSAVVWKSGFKHFSHFFFDVIKCFLHPTDLWGVTYGRPPRFSIQLNTFRRCSQGLFRPQVLCTPSLNCPIDNSVSIQGQQLANRPSKHQGYSGNTRTVFHPSTVRSQMLIDFSDLARTDTSKWTTLCALWSHLSCRSIWILLFTVGLGYCRFI